MTRRTDTSPRAMAARYARSEWGGPLDFQRKVSDFAWAFSTPGHGGIVAILDENDPRWAQIDRVNAAIRWNIVGDYWSIDGSPIRAVLGEEDCAWALVVLLFPEIADGIAKRPGRYFDKTFDTSEKVLDLARERVRADFPQALEILGLDAVAAS